MCDENIPSLWNDEISEMEVVEGIRSLLVGKAAGEDRPLNEMVKSSYNTMSPYTAQIFNAIWNSGVYPSSWDTAVLCQIYKKVVEVIKKSIDVYL